MAKLSELRSAADVRGDALRDPDVCLSPRRYADH